MEWNKKLTGIGIGIFLLIGCGCMNEQAKLVEKANALGYQVEQEDSVIIIKQEGASYRFTISNGKVQFVEVQKEINPIGDVVVMDHKGLLTINVLSKEQVRVTIEDTVETKLANGKVMPFNETRSIVCGVDFLQESIDPKSAEAMLGKADKYYATITNDWLSVADLKALYEQGITIEEALEGIH